MLSPKPGLLQNYTFRSPLDSNSVTRRLISWLLRRFRTLTSSLAVMPRVDQNRAGVTRWVRLTDTVDRFSDTVAGLFHRLGIGNIYGPLAVGACGQLGWLVFADWVFSAGRRPSAGVLSRLFPSERCAGRNRGFDDILRRQ